MSSSRRYCRSRLRCPTSSIRPRRVWWSCLWVFRCSVRYLMRWVRSATWTSGEPVSPSVVAYSLMISCLVAVSKAMALLGRCAAPRGLLARALWTSGRPAARSRRSGSCCRGCGVALRGRYNGSLRVSAGRRRADGPRPESAPGHLDIEVHLLDQGLGRVELQGGPLEVDELQTHGVTVQLQVVVVMDVRLDRAPGASRWRWSRGPRSAGGRRHGRGAARRR